MAYKLFVRECRSRSDKDLETKHQNTLILQKWVNVYNFLLDKYKGEGHAVKKDSAYVGAIMAALIGLHECKISKVGTAQENIADIGTLEEKK